MKEKTSTLRTSAAMTRKIVWLLSALCLLFVFDARSDEPVEGENLIYNGDFEIHINDDNFGWENKATVRMNAGDTPEAINGLTLRMGGPAGSRQIWQEVNVVPGQNYVIRFTGRIMNSNSASGADVNNHSEFGPATLSCIILVGEFNIDDELNSATELFAISTQSNTDVLVEGVFAIPQGITSITVKLHKDHNVAFVDDVELRTTTAEVTLPTLVERVKHIYGIYPNPARDHIFLNNTEKVISISILSVAGQEVKKQLANGQSTLQLDVSYLNPGVYFISILDADQNRYTERFIRQ